MKKIVYSPRAPKAIGPYSQAVQAGNMVFLSGQIPIDPDTGELISGTIEEQTEAVLRNISAVLEEAGGSLLDVVKTTVFLTDLNNFEGMNKVYSKFFNMGPPARSTVGVSALPRGVRVEIDAVAILAA